MPPWEVRLWLHFDARDGGPVCRLYFDGQAITRSARRRPG